MHAAAAHVHVHAAAAAHVRAPAHVDFGIYFVKNSASAFFDDQSFRFQDPSFYGPDELYEKSEKEVKNKNKPAYYMIY